MIAALIVQTVVIIALCGLIGWLEFNNRKERKSLLNMIKSKDASDFANLELADNTKIEVKPEPNNDLRDLSELSDEEWEKAVKN